MIKSTSLGVCHLFSILLRDPNLSHITLRCSSIVSNLRLMMIVNDYLGYFFSYSQGAAGLGRNPSYRKAIYSSTNYLLRVILDSVRGWSSSILLFRWLLNAWEASKSPLLRLRVFTATYRWVNCSICLPLARTLINLIAAGI